MKETRRLEDRSSMCDLSCMNNYNFELMTHKDTSASQNDRIYTDVISVIIFYLHYD